MTNQFLFQYIIDSLIYLVVLVIIVYIVAKTIFFLKCIDNLIKFSFILNGTDDIAYKVKPIRWYRPIHTFFLLDRDMFRQLKLDDLPELYRQIQLLEVEDKELYNYLYSKYTTIIRGLAYLSKK